MPVLFNGGEEISLMLGLKNSFKRWCYPAARETHDGKMLGVSLHCVTCVVRPDLHVCPLLAGEGGRQCLSLARRKRKRKVDLSTSAIEREDGSHSCSESVGRDRRTKRPCDSCEELAAISAAVLAPKGECPRGIDSPRNYFSKLSKDVASSHHFPSTVGSQRQEIKNNTLYNVLEDKFGCALLSRRDGREKRTGTHTALLICCGSWAVFLGGPGVFMELACVGRSRISSGVPLTPG